MSKPAPVPEPVYAAALAIAWAGSVSREVRDTLRRYTHMPDVVAAARRVLVLAAERGVARECRG